MLYDEIEATAATNCDDGNLCTKDLCDPLTGCYHEQVNCDDGNVCTVDSCDPQQGCVHQPMAVGTPCGCTGAMTCELKGDEIVCDRTGDAAVACDDKDPCTWDDCDSEGNCVHELACWPRDCPKDWIELTDWEAPPGCTFENGKCLKFAEPLVHRDDNGNVVLVWGDNDKDNDGLPDNAEYAIARHFRPLFAFDSQYKGLDDWEPVVIYQVRPTPVCADGQQAGPDCCPKGLECIDARFVALYDTTTATGRVLRALGGCSKTITLATSTC